VVICDRYLASSIAYGEAQGSTARWLRDIQRYLPPPDLTILLDIAPETRGPEDARIATSTSATSRCCRACARATAARRQAGGWLRLDGERRRIVVRPTCSRQSRHCSRGR
jgi:thymidylate kinase